MDSRKVDKNLTYVEAIKAEVNTIKEKDLKDAKRLGENTSPGFASFVTGMPLEEITGEAKKRAEKDAHLQKRSRELFQVDNGYLAKINKASARKAYGFTEKEVREILIFRERQNKIRIKNNEPGFFTQTYQHLRNYFQPEKVEDEKWLKKQHAKERRETIRKKYGIQ